MRLIAGPMATLSHEAFRRRIEEFGGCDEHFTEMINATSLLNMGPFEKFYLMSGPAPEKIVWQLTGWEADSMAAASEILLPLGGIGIDLNMGCSAPQIVKTGAGIAWMMKPLSETERLVRMVKKVTGKKARLSVKCRLGNDGFTDDDFFRFTDMLVQNGVQSITLHPRTRREKERGFPRYGYAQKLCERYRGESIRVNINGMIRDADSAERAISICPGADGIMISRECAARPWIFAKIRKELDGAGGGQKTLVDRKKVALDFLSDLKEFQPKEFFRTRAKRFFSYYCQQFSFGHFFATRMRGCGTPEESASEIEAYFEKVPEDRFIEF